MDRSVEIAMQRKKNERVERLRRRDNADHTRLRQRCRRWADDNQTALPLVTPRVLNELNDRAFDVWEPIADHVGGDWTRFAVEAALALSARESVAEEKSVELLAAAKVEFDRIEWPAMPTKKFITALCSDEERPWATWHDGKQITPRQLAALLKPFEIISDTVHPNETGEDKAKGYRRSRFEEAFERYLTAPSDASAQNMRAQACIRASVDEMGTSSDFPIRAENFTHGCEKREKSANDGHMHGCTDKISKTDGEAHSDQAAGPNGGQEFPRVCVHCGAPATTYAPFQLCAVNGEEFALHRHCQADWLSESDTPTSPNLSIPPFLQRTPIGEG
jgi:Protein of unknown function (DUF3631)